jgi:hypothetical protein
MLFNVDRWIYYSAQRLNTSRIGEGFMTKMTPRQLRRCKKKARKNNDSSIGRV